jgi:co-chaperonin GroES (HSP10)
MSDLVKSKSLNESDSKAQSARRGLHEDYLKPAELKLNKKGQFEIKVIHCYNDYVAIVPIERSSVSKGGIITDVTKKNETDIGIIVGVGPDARNFDAPTTAITNSGAHRMRIGEFVKFSAKHAIAELTDEYQHYDNVGAAVKIVKAINIFAAIEPLFETVYTDNETAFCSRS